MKSILFLFLPFLILSSGFSQGMCTHIVVNYSDTLEIPLHQKSLHINQIPPRYQWENNSGYCGEVSLVSAGLYYGQYLSQYDVRAIICGQCGEDTCQMLLGVNDAQAAQALRLRHERKITQDSKEFLRWVKHHVTLGHPVIIGVMNNEYLLYGDTNSVAGQPDYDHIVPVIGIGSDMPFSGKYEENDVILFSDNGLITVNGNNPAVPGNKNVPYYYTYRFGSFVGNREKANLPNGHPYTLVQLPNEDQGDSIFNYGIALLGIDGEEETLPVQISTNWNYEAPAIRDSSNTRPKPMPLELSAKISNLQPGVKYFLYRYKNEQDVPRSNFNQESHTYVEKIEFTLRTGSEFIMQLNILSDEKVFLRCVKAKG